MKKINLYLMALLAGTSMVFPGCSDDIHTGDEEYSSERLFMPMFRVEENTNQSSDHYSCSVASDAPDCSSNFVNDVILYWYGVEGASGYHLKAKVQGTDWELNCVLDTILDPDQLEFLHEDLQYSTGYSYAIQALSPRGEFYNSKWYGYGDGSHQKDYVTITTGLRYDVPSVFWTEDITKESLRVYFNNIAEEGYETTYKEFIEAGAEVVDGLWIFNEIQLVPTADNPNLPTLSHIMTDSDFDRGYVDFDGLVSNGAYIVQGLNSNVARYFDRQYNKTMLRMLGDPGEPILIEAIVDPNDTILSQRFVSDLQATRLDTVLTNYMGDNNMAEGQVFYLEGGKYYYVSTNVELTKGFTLETNPEDLAGNGRATIYLGVGTTTASGTEGSNQNFNLARNAQDAAENGVTLTIQDIRFNEINFQPQTYYNFLDVNAADGNSQLAISANYFMNMSSQGLLFSLSELSITNCTFSGCVREFIRFQGPNRQIIQRLTVEGCVFYDNGVYDTTGRGYSWFAGPGNNRFSNFYQNFTFRNNTIIDSPHNALVTENGLLAWLTGTHWNIVIENNTIINFSPRSSSSGHGLLFEIRYAPGGSNLTVRKNLFVMVRKGNADARDLYMRGMRIDTKNINYDFADNYAITVPDWTTATLADGLFTNYAFSNSSDGAGYLSGAFNVGGFGETQIKYGDNVNGNESDGVGYQLTPEELFRNPAPLAAEGSKDMHRYNNDGFYYNLTPRIMAHPIYTKNIGDPRWKTGGAWK
ncbi:MAG: right-handed parallel beta-helix repeat-containing protein [Bacteroides sp.]|nr:right-handed parallel beta-helix repeat-containing protein [Bacteroides sp.]